MADVKILDIQDNIDSHINWQSLMDKEVELTGMVQNIRLPKWGAFIILRLANYNIQTVVENGKINIEPSTIPVEATIRVKGTVRPSQIKDLAICPRDIEIAVTNIEILSIPSLPALPLDTTKKDIEAGLDTKFNLRPLTLRHPKQRAIFKISATIFNEFGNFLTKNGFTRICSPKIVFSGAEGGANIFKLEYFDRNAYLAQSPQFYKQMMVGAFGRVFETGPVFRAEKHDTSRHLNEYVSMDIEMALQNGYEELIQVETNALKYIFDKVASDCANEVALLGIEMPVIDKIYTFRFNDIKQIIFDKYGKDYRGEKDLCPEEEALISKYVKDTYNSDLVFITHYPTIKRPFYAMPDPANPDETLSFDCLFRGLEITTGGERLYKYDDYVTNMKKRGMNVDLFQSYLQTFQYGMPPHGGLGIGLERVTAQLCGLSNVKEASLFPRDINRLEP